MSEPVFAAVSTAGFFAVCFAWVPFLDSVVRMTAFLKRRRAVAQINLRVLFPEAQG